MQIKKKLIKRQIAGDTFLVPVGKSVYSSNGMFALTEVGAFIWDLLPEAKDQEDILKAVLAEYDVEEEVARNDIGAYFNKLRQLEIID